MGELSIILSVLLYTFGIILLIVLIILGIKMIGVVDKADKVLDNMDQKFNSLNNLFLVMNKASEGLSSITETLIFTITNSIARVFGKKEKKEEDVSHE